MEFEKLCLSPKKLPLDPKKVVAEFLKYKPQVFADILKSREDLYKELLDILLEEESSSLKSFVGWYRDYLYNY